MTSINLNGLRPAEYEHPDDSAALQALRRTGGLDTLVAKINEWGLERMLRIQTTGSYLRVTQDNLPDLWAIFATACKRLSLPYTPDLYIGASEEINAYTAGVKNPVIVVNSGTIDHLSEDELLFVIAHEMGHIKSCHVLYYQIASYIPILGSIVGDLTFGVGQLLSVGLGYALLHWQRTSELTADRAGLLGCQDAQVAFRAMMKLAGLPRKYAAKANVEDFLEQARHFEAFDVSRMDRIAKYLSISGAHHPWTVMRAKELLNWIEGHGYDRVLRAPRPPDGARLCPNCGAEVGPTLRFCDRCSHQLPALPPPQRLMP